VDINKLPIIGAEDGKKPKLAVQYTIDGEVLCKNVKGALIPQPLRTVDLEPGYDLPEFTQAMSRFWALVEAVREDTPDRKVPITKEDILSFMVCSKKELRTMMEKGLLKEVLVPIIDTFTGKNLGSRRLVYFTPQGRAFVRKYVKPDYAVTENR
jgi:hypothetical protein